MVEYYLVAILAGILSAFSQILLKKSSLRSSSVVRGFLAEYLNPYVVCAYGITFLCMLLMIWAYKGIPYKVGPVLEALSYIYILLFSRWFLNEKITIRRLIGNIMIFAGVIVFNIK